MGKTVLYIATSIDGRIADTNGQVGFLDAYGSEAEDYGYAQFIQRIGTVIMGAATYEKVLSFSYWYEGKDHIIFASRQLTVPAGRSIRQLSGDPTELVAELRQRPTDTWLVGGAALLSCFLQRGLVDEMIITVVPEYLGDGITLWQDTMAAASHWQLLQCRSFADGVVQLHYQNAAPLA